MAILPDRINQRGIRAGTGSTPPAISPLPTINQQISRPPARALTTTPISQRVGQSQQRGSLASTFQGGAVKKRFLADLPANVQLQGIQDILSGQDSTNPIINNFVRGMAARGSQPEEIRQAFIAEQKKSGNPLVLA